MQTQIKLNKQQEAIPQMTSTLCSSSLRKIPARKFSETEYSLEVIPHSGYNQDKGTRQGHHPGLGMAFRAN